MLFSNYTYLSGFLSLAILLFSTTITAQSPLDEEQDWLADRSEEMTSLSPEEDIILPSIVEDNLYYIDLSVVEGKASDIRLMDANGNILKRYSAKDLPKDSFFELDLSNLPKSNYTISIRTYKREYKRVIGVR